MAEIMFPNVAYRATVYRTGAKALKNQESKKQKNIFLNPKKH